MDAEGWLKEQGYEVSFSGGNFAGGDDIEDDWHFRVVKGEERHVARRLPLIAHKLGWRPDAAAVTLQGEEEQG